MRLLQFPQKLEDRRTHGLESNRVLIAGHLIHVEAPVDLDHHRHHAPVLAIVPHRHDRTGEWRIACCTESERDEMAMDQISKARRRMEAIGSYADIRTRDRLIRFMRKRHGRKGMAIHDQGHAGPGNGFIDSILKLTVEAVVDHLHILSFRFIGNKPIPPARLGIDSAHSDFRHDLILIIPEALDTDVYDEIIRVSDEDAFATARMTGRLEGFLCGISSGAALRAAIEVAKRDGYSGKDIAVILPDGGDRYMSTELF